MRIPVTARAIFFTTVLTRLLFLPRAARPSSSSKSVSELFYERGIAVNAHVNKDVFSGISRVKSYLARGNGTPDLYIFDTCKNMIAEFKSYSWGAGDSPVKKFDHAMDELRYLIMSRPLPARAEEADSPLKRDKERRIRRSYRKIER